MSAIRKLAGEAIDNGLLAPDLGGHQPREKRQVDWGPHGELAVAAGRPGAAWRPGCPNNEKSMRIDQQWARDT